MTIEVRILTGHNAPWSQEFDQDEITIGRAGEADVRMHPTWDTVCASKIHARLLRGDNGWFLRAEHDSGVAIQTRQGSSIYLGFGETTPLDGEVEITIGRGGPTLRVSPNTKSGVGIPITVNGPDQAPPISQVPARVVKNAPSVGRRFAVSAGGLLAVIVLVAASLGSQFQRMEQTVRVQGDELNTTKSSLASISDEVRAEISQTLRDGQDAVFVVSARSSEDWSPAFGTVWRSYQSHERNRDTN